MGANQSPSAKGDAQIRLNNAVKLVVVCEEDHQHSRLFADILRALKLKTANING